MIIEIQLTTNFWARLSTSYCTPFRRSSFHLWVSKKSFISLGLRPRTVACKRKLLPVKLFSYKTMNFYIKKMYVIKHNLTIYFACEMNKMDSLVCVVIQPWISLFWFSAPDWDCCTKCSYFTCLIQVSHITFETYRGLKSLNTTTSS